MSAPVRVGVVGYGLGGRVFHVPVIEGAGLEVSHVATSNPERAAQAQAAVPGARIVGSLADLLADAELPDVVVLTSPSAHHAAQAHEVIDAGIAVVVDKPLATDAAAAQAVVEHAEAAAVPLTVYQNRRWDDEQRTLRALLEAGVLGQVHRFERRWERWRPEPLDRWKETDTVGGGLLLDLGAHLVDAAVQMFGPAVRVYAEVRGLKSPADDDVFLALTHANSVVSHLSAGGVVGAPGPRTRVLGDRGAFLVTSFEGEPNPFSSLDADGAHAGWLVHGEQRTPVPVEPGEPADFYRAVAAWIREGAPAPVDPWDAVRTAAVLDAARESARTGQVVTLG
ncbi:MAG: Gfo/Idh/MocA family oxidoreductase [Actinomycetales bacterium]|nr:Gfo/Idh/MocA family oxidoreductase [Actinomycetales bacterium]